VLFDVDGTLADTERDGHRPAFNPAFAEFGLAERWGDEDYGRPAVTGGRRRIEGFLAERGHADPAGLGPGAAPGEVRALRGVGPPGAGAVPVRVDRLIADLRTAACGSAS